MRHFAKLAVALCVLFAALALTGCSSTGFPAIKVTIPTPLGPAVLDSQDATDCVTEPLGITKPAPAPDAPPPAK